MGMLSKRKVQCNCNCTGAMRRRMKSARKLLVNASYAYEWQTVGEGAEGLAAPVAVVPKEKNKKQPAVVHFLGGALVGAVPKATYGYLITELASRGFAVVAGSYALTFDHRTSANAVAKQRDDALEVLGIKRQVDDGEVPVFAIGHSNGALLQTLISSLPELSRTSVQPRGTALLGYNNLPVSLAVPGGIPEEAPGALRSGLSFIDFLSLPPAWRALAYALNDEQVAKEVGPLLDQLNSTLREARATCLHDITCSCNRHVRQLTKKLPVHIQIADGSRDFTPTPEQSRQIAADGYQCPSTLLLRFRKDSIDDSATLAQRLK